MQLWRISNFADLSGRGGLLGDGRWHRRGVSIVYCADHPSTALLEIMVHATRDTVPDSYQLIEINVSDEFRMANATLRPGWETDPQFTRNLGSDFIAARKHALLKVPSAIMPKASNYLLNPEHGDARRISIANAYRYPFDSRLLK
jgi:RES domain-containing protein